MAMIRASYQLQYEQIASDTAMGSASVVPWDQAIFGFPVACFQPGSGDFDQNQMDHFRSSFAAWMRTRNISLCSSTLAPAQVFWRQVLQQVGFDFVDLSLQVTLSLPSAMLPAVRSQLRLALPADHAAIEAIAAESFAHGRYHADPRFPKHLANRRYLLWVRNTLNAPSEVDRMYVLEEGGAVKGFYHVTIDGEVSDLRLMALAADSKGTMQGVELFSAMLHELQRQNVHRVVASISATNLSIVNLFSRVGCRFRSPEIVYHWHAAQPGHASQTG